MSKQSFFMTDQDYTMLSSDFGTMDRATMQYTTFASGPIQHNLDETIIGYFYSEMHINIAHSY